MLTGWLGGSLAFGGFGGWAAATHTVWALAASMVIGVLLWLWGMVTLLRRHRSRV
jgi:hypothetical protein